MNVTLNRNSWHYKIYSTVLDENPPKSLCPYFWSLVAIIVFSPIILLIGGIGWTSKKFDQLTKWVSPPKQKPEKTWEQVQKEWDEERVKSEKRRQRVNKRMDIFIWIAKYIIVPIAALGLVVLVYLSANKIGWYEFLISVLVGILIMSPILGFVWFIEKYGEKIGGFIGKVFRKINPFNWSVTKIIGGMIYSTYKKACPLINWEGENSKETENVYN